MKHCLIVDDSDVIRKVAAHLLADYGFETSDAEHGQDALEKCIARMPDVILLDWHMPVMAGMEFISSLRLQPSGDKPHVIYCTTEYDPQDIARALAAGADDFLLKPFDRDGLRAKFADVKAAA
jgi:two-component system, chemotaxis family, chemotaxis protein CheY